MSDNETMLPSTNVVDQALALQRVSKGLFDSGLFPSARSPAGAFAIVEYGHEIGIPPMMALQNINIIQGKLSCNGQLLLSKALQKDVTYNVVEETDKGCTIDFKRGDNTYRATFNEADATAAGLLGKTNWKQYPKDMYFWRAAVKGIRRVAPDAIMGLYTPDELSGGEIIDVEAEEIPADATVVENSNGHPPYIKKADLIKLVLELESEVFDSDTLRDDARQGSLGGKTPQDATVKELTAYREALTNQEKTEAGPPPDRTTVKRAIMALEDKVYPGGKAYTNARKKYLNGEVDLGKADLALMIEYGKHMREREQAA